MDCQKVIKMKKRTFGRSETLQDRKEMHTYKNVISLFPLSIKNALLKNLIFLIYLIFINTYP